MSKILYAAAILVLLLLGIVFAILNAETVTLNYYFASRQIPLSLVIMLAMLIGAVLGVFASISVIMKSRHELSRLRKAVNIAEKEIANLRAIPIKDTH